MTFLFDFTLYDFTILNTVINMTDYTLSLVSPFSKSSNLEMSWGPPNTGAMRKDGSLPISGRDLSFELGAVVRRNPGFLAAPPGVGCLSHRTERVKRESGS